MTNEEKDEIQDKREAGKRRDTEPCANNGSYRIDVLSGDILLVGKHGIQYTSDYAAARHHRDQHLHTQADVLV